MPAAAEVPRADPATSGTATSSASEGESHNEQDGFESLTADSDGGSNHSGGRLPDGSLRESIALPPDHGLNPKAGTSTSYESIYGNPISPEEAAEQLPPGGGGLVWKVKVVGDNWRDKSTDKEGNLKPRRGSLIVKSTHFFSSLVKTLDGRWIFSGVLNGWPGMTCLELRAFYSAGGEDQVNWLGLSCGCGGRGKINWEAARNPDDEPPPRLAPMQTAWATMRSAPCTARGWTPDKPNYVWWFRNFRPQGPHVDWGDGMVRKVHQDAEELGVPVPECVKATVFAHRYALGAGKIESPQDLVTYHSAVLLEWDHGQFCSVVELANFNGVGGRNGRSNWYHDRDATHTHLLKHMPPVLVAPYRDELAEIRVLDVEAKNTDEFMEYLQFYTGPDKRFLDPQFHHSGQVRVRNRSQADLMQYMMNYMSRDLRYIHMTRSCQSFVADFYQFLVGSKDIAPFSLICRVAYKPRPYMFLYEPGLHEIKAGDSFSLVP